MKDFTDITLLLDCSGSMMGVKGKTEDAVNDLVTEQASSPGEAVFSLVEFSGSRDKVREKISCCPIKSVERYRFQPGGWTPLIEACIKTINQTGERLAGIPESERPDKVVFVIVTDGLENASDSEFTFQALSEMVKLQSEVYEWDFMFIGAGLEAFNQYQSIGVAASTSLQASRGKLDHAIRASSGKIRSYRSTSAKIDLCYTDEERSQLK